MDDRGRTLAGRYELEEVIGRGGMGTVYRAVDLVLRRPVAVKMLPGTPADQDPTNVARFEREARAAAKLSHPAVVAVYDAGADATSRYLVMELISGRSLEAILHDEGPLDPGRAAGIAARVADALAAAHAAGIVHRDIKPANVMVDKDGSVKVLDFGIARAIGGTTLTQTTSVLGTAAYMSPEQALGEPADERSDVYALGCVLYALLAGHPPFTGDAAAAMLHQHANVAPRALRTENGRVPPELEALVMQMLAKAPGDRPQSAAQVRDRLAGRPATATTQMPTAPTRPQPATAVTRPRPPAPHPNPNRRRLLLAGALLSVALVVAVIALASGGSSPQRTTRGRRAATASKPVSTTPARTPTKTSTTPTTPTTPKTLTVAQAAGALTALSTRDVQSGTIDQQAAEQISGGLANVLNSYATGNPATAQQQLTNLAQQVAMLEQQGHVRSDAAPALNNAIANLSTALAHAPAAPTQTTGAPPSHPKPPATHPAKPPGHGGEPPGQAKHDKSHGH
jgi:serine/threonine-protein kinase